MSIFLQWLPNFVLIILLLCGCGPVLTSSRSIVAISPQEAGTIGYYLPKGILHLECKPKDNKYELSCTADIVPDQNQFYIVKYHPSAAAEDKINIGLQNDGLLTSVSTTTSDKWVEIIKKLAQIPKEAAKAMAVPGKVLKPGTNLEVSVDVQIDPDLFIYDDANSIYERNRLLRSLTQDYGIEVNLFPIISRSEQYNQAKSQPSERDGVYYRLPIPYTLEVKFDVITETVATTTAQAPTDTNPPAGTQPVPTPPSPTGQKAKGKSKSGISPTQQKAQEQQAQQTKEIHKTKYCLRKVFFLPNGGPILSLDVLRAAFVEKKNEISFEKGMLTGVNQTKPSEILEGLNIPLEIIKAFVSLPTDLIQIKINYSKAEEANLKQMLNEIVARESLINKLNEIKGGKKQNTTIDEMN